jgi:flavin reductase (DIM6/NTAB) family NADH-FMN oxidoreductase RutF
MASLSASGSNRGDLDCRRTRPARYRSEELDQYGSARLAASGLSLVPAQRVAAPLIAECAAHLECTLMDTRSFGDEVLVFGKIVAASIDPACLEGAPVDRYARLRPFFFLEDGYYAPLGEARQ